MNINVCQQKLKNNCETLTNAEKDHDKFDQTQKESNCETFEQIRKKTIKQHNKS